MQRYDIPASFYVPGVSALLHPEDVTGIAAAGHEIGLHGWIHERNSLLEPADERDLTLRAAEVLEKLTGTAPVGLRTASWDFSDATLSIIRDMGLLYDSSLMGDERTLRNPAGRRADRAWWNCRWSGSRTIIPTSAWTA